MILTDGPKKAGSLIRLTVHYARVTENIGATSFAEQASSASAWILVNTTAAGVTCE